LAAATTAASDAELKSSLQELPVSQKEKLLAALQAIDGVPEKKQQSEKAKKMLLAVFKYYDRDNNGTLSMKELKHGIAQTGLTLEYMKAADIDGDKLVTKEEWVTFFDVIPDKEVQEIRDWLLDKQPPAAKEMLLEIYAKYDTNGDNSLSMDELRKGIEAIWGLSFDYMSGADKDGDQKVSKEEWLQFFDPIPDKEVEDMRAWLSKK
jgi:Ca2+-binding EF-hand superfamily protein